ncbi:MAG: tRNA dihydrouridine synthase DusB [Halobacteriovoraceae bacterium]|nr:tRNA dihydrouridine synthase DusB [Halobacteriovoraceae bacterium]|tara:strand:+ start:15310 stop:16395 length:1086 start_codon:yes stop_codon:yes gene_type:complete
MQKKKFSPKLQAKIDSLKSKREAIQLGEVSFASKVLLAPMAGICNAPFRLLMEDLGAGGTVSELISANGINHGNDRTLSMLELDEREEHVGIQLFGEDTESMAKAAEVAQRYNPKFLDINMGCPVRKVVTKGGGSALMRDPEFLGPFFAGIRKAINIPLSIKIRTGWDAESLNAEVIEKIAYNEGIEWVAIHGRTRTQQYTGFADWDYIENIAENSILPIIGNGDLHQAYQVQNRLQQTKCDALMIARGCLRNPFIFLEAFNETPDQVSLFDGSDYFEVSERLYDYMLETFDNPRIQLTQMRKLIVWFAAGFPSAAKFRSNMFASKDLDEVMQLSQNFFMGLGDRPKYINYNEVFMNGGHG